MLHRLYDMLRRADMPSSGKAFKTPEGYLVGWGTTVPSAAEGYAPGCLFIHTDGTAATQLYVNEGTKATSSFVAQVT